MPVREPVQAQPVQQVPVQAQPIVVARGGLAAVVANLATVDEAVATTFDNAGRAAAILGLDIAIVAGLDTDIDKAIAAHGEAEP